MNNTEGMFTQNLLEKLTCCAWTRSSYGSDPCLGACPYLMTCGWICASQSYCIHCEHRSRVHFYYRLPFPENNLRHFNTNKIIDIKLSSRSKNM